MTTNQTVEEYPAPRLEWIGEYAIANKNGLVHPWTCRYLLQSQAQQIAHEKVGQGHYGECWPVKLTDPSPRLRQAVPELLQAIYDCLPDLQHYADTHGPGPDRRLEKLRDAIARDSVAEGGGTS